MYYFIINPASGSGRGRKVWNIVKKELDRLDIQYRYFILRSSGEGTQLAASISARETDCTITVVGGDGTIDEVINGLTSFEHITFACIPTGSGNDFVRGLGLVRDPIEALHAILNPAEIRPINIGISEFSRSDALPGAPCAVSSGQPDIFCHHFAVSSGIGYDAAVCYQVERSGLKKVLNRFHSGKLVYLLTALWQLISMQRLDFEITIDDQERISCKKGYFAAAMNLRYEGGGFLFCPEALPDNDQLEVLIVNGISRFQALCLLPLALKGKHIGHKGIRIVRCRKFQVKSPEKCCIHTDGEVLGFSDEITFSLHEKKLAVIIR